MRARDTNSGVGLTGLLCREENVLLNTRLKAARAVAEALTPSEADIETAIASTSRLIQAIATARGQANLPIAVGQDSLAALGAAMVALIDARGSIGRAHASLAHDRINAGLSAYAMGDVSDCPPAGTLTVVEEQRSAA
jgi:hypothetical protein